MKSKPVYAPPVLDTSARRHLFLTQGPEGRDTACRVMSADPEAAVTLAALDHRDAEDAALDEALAQAGMDTAFYVAGPEAFLWRTAARLRRAGVELRRIHLTLSGSAARRVYCVHCGAVMENVIGARQRCATCGLMLTVRDHFSRPMQAYMGVIAE